MNKKVIIYSFVGAALVLGGWLFYRNNRNTKIDETPIDYDEAIKKIEEIK